MAYPLLKESLTTDRILVPVEIAPNVTAIPPTIPIGEGDKCYRLSGAILDRGTLKEYKKHGLVLHRSIDYVLQTSTNYPYFLYHSDIRPGGTPDDPEIYLPAFQINPFSMRNPGARLRDNLRLFLFYRGPGIRDKHYNLWIKRTLRHANCLQRSARDPFPTSLTAQAILHF